MSSDGRYYLAMPFDGRKQRHELHHNRKLYKTEGQARGQITRWSTTGRVLLVDINALQIVGVPNPMEQFLYAEGQALYWGNEMRRLDDLMHGRERLVLG